MVQRLFAVGAEIDIGAKQPLKQAAIVLAAEFHIFGGQRRANVARHACTRADIAAEAATQSARDALALQTENAQLKEQLAKVQQEHQQLLADTEDMRQAATTALNLEEEHQRMLTENQLLQTHADVLKAENEKLKDTDRFNHWLYGGGLILGGILLSLILQAIGRRKRKSEWR